MPTPYFDSLSAAWQMAGHGPYVWFSYAIFLVVLVALVWSPLARQRHLLRELRAAERRRDARTAAQAVSQQQHPQQHPSQHPSQQKSQG